MVMAPVYYNMERGSTNAVRESAQKMDKSLAGVMPDYWEGHARIAIRESEHVPLSIEEDLIEKVNKLADEKGVTPERVAKKIISHIADNESLK